MLGIESHKGNAIAFDIGNVCIAISAERCQQATGISADMPKWCELCQWLEWGRISTQAFLSEAERLVPPGHHLDGGMLEAFNAKILSPVPGMEALLEKLSNAGIKPVFFSDISQLHLDCFRRRFACASKYQGIYSFEVGAWKPSKAMFQAFEEQYGMPLLYVDDRLDLVEAAIEHGWKNSIIFKDAIDLEHRISNILNVKIKGDRT